MPSEEYVHLRGSKIIVPATALKIIWRLEDLGYAIKVVAGQFAITPPPGAATLNKKQLDSIARHKKVLSRIAKYVEGEEFAR